VMETPQCFVCRKPIQFNDRVVITMTTEDVAVFHHFGCVSVEEIEEIQKDMEERHER